MQLQEPEVWEVARHPYWGLWVDYNKNDDMWAADRFPGNMAYRRTFHKLLLKWLAQGGGPTYKIDGCYVWNVGSW